MEYRILGPLEVRGGGRSISLGTAKQQTLLAVLVLHANEFVPRERLVDELWGQSPPPTAAKAVQVYVSHLRKLLAYDGDQAIATHPRGYVLSIDGDGVDALSFERLAREARDRAADGDAEQAASLFREALGLWRGPALAGITFESLAATELDRLEEERTAVLMDRIDCDLSLGRHEQLLGELEAVVAEHPLQERFRGQLMLALYRSGRQADALRVYREGRETLVEQLGLEPSEPLQRLERAILTHDPALEAPAGLTRPKGPAPPEEAAVSVDRRRRLSRRVVAAAALVLAAIASVVAVLVRSGAPAEKLLEPNSVGFIDAESGRVTRSFPTGGREPSALTVAYHSVWVCNFLDKTVTRIDPATEAGGHAIPVGGHPIGITSYRGNVWVWTFEGRLVPIDPRFDTPGDPIEIRESISSRRGLRTPSTGRIIAGGGFLWITARGTTVIRVDPREPKRAKRIGLEAGVNGPIAFGDGKAWVTGSELVFPIVAGSGTVLSGRPVGGVVRDLAFGGDSLLVVSGGWNSGTLESVYPALRRVDPDTRVAEAPIRVGDRPVALTVAADLVWVASQDDRGGMIYRVDPTRNKVVDVIALGANPTAIAGDADGVWVTVA